MKLNIFNLKKASLISSLVILTACSGSDNKQPEVVNTAPVIANISAQEISANQASDAIILTVSDDSTASGSLQIILSSSDQSLVLDENLVLSTFVNSISELVITPVNGKTGSVEISISVSDADNATSSTRFSITITEQQLSADVLIRRIFSKDKNTLPESLDAISVVQDITDEEQYLDLINGTP